jgi:murein L,D-transpeptidase YcbB/YkuD
VFRFPNDFSIYLHDTNNRGAFQRDRRTVSHGCVRVQKPFELACYLLPDADEWTRESIRISMDMPPVTERGITWVRQHANAERPFRLISYHGVKPHVPLYIIYYTAFPNPKTGAVEYWPDHYGFDKVISKELKWISARSSKH